MRKPPRSDQSERRYPRFQPEGETILEIDPDPHRPTFTPVIRALVVDGGYGGCGVVLVTSPHLPEGSVCRVKAGDLPPVRAEVKWRVQLDLQVVKVGLMFLE